MKTIELHITLQPQVLDTQGQALNRAVHDLGITQLLNQVLMQRMSIIVKRL